MLVEHQGEHESQWAAIGSIAAKIGCSTEALRKWVPQAERDQGIRGALTSNERDRLTELEREVRELRRANEIHVLAVGGVKIPYSIKPKNVMHDIRSQCFGKNRILTCRPN